MDHAALREVERWISVTISGIFFPRGRVCRSLPRFCDLWQHVSFNLLPSCLCACSVQKYFGIESHEDAPVPNLPGCTMSRPVSSVLKICLVKNRTHTDIM